LVVGTRGRNLGGMQGLLPGSVSKYCLQQSPIPVIVVRPEAKRAKRKAKRKQNPNRGNYSRILELSEGSEHLLNKANRDLQVGGGPAATTEEAIAVAKALGLPKFMEKVDDGAPLAKVQSAKSDGTSGPESPSPTGPLSPDPMMVVMKSPVLGGLDSPLGSDQDDDYRDERRVKFESQPGRASGAVVDDDMTRKRPVESSSSASDGSGTNGKG
jgi:hypothetical protein